MDSKQVKDLMEAYASVYSSLNEEEMEDAENEGKEKEGKESGKDEGGKHKEGKHKKGKEEPGEKKTEKEDVEEGLNPIAVNKEPKKGGPSTLGQLIGDKLAGDKSFTKGKPPTAVVHGIKKEEVETDLFDVILEYLVAEGYADTNKAALAIMANMSEEWKQSIVEQLDPDSTGGTYDDFKKLHHINDIIKKMTPAQQKKYLDGLPRVGQDGKPLKGA